MVDIPTDASLLRFLPGLRTLSGYRREWLARDLAAGLVLTTMLVPTGIAYAEASGVLGIYGLYATVSGLLAYALFGPSRIMVLGPDSSLVAVILAVVLPLSAGDPGRAIACASAMACVAGLACVAAGYARLGFVTELLSKPIRYGYMNGIALTVIVSQLPRVLGFDVDSEAPLQQLREVAQGVLDGRVQVWSLLVGVGALAAIRALRRWPRVPGPLVAVAAASVGVMALHARGLDGVDVLGVLPRGLPVPAFPRLQWGDVIPVLEGGLAVALISFADTSVLSRVYSARLRERVDPNQEMVALGAANLAAGFFQGIAVSGSASRTPVAEAAGARTQLAGVVGALAIAGLLATAPGLLQHLPRSALAAVVVSAAIGLVEVGDLRRILRVQPWEFWLSMACFAGVVSFGAVQGIGIALVIAVTEFLWDGWRPHSAVLGRVEKLPGYHDVTRHPSARRIPGLVLFRWDAPLFFANAELFHERVRKAVSESPTAARRVVVAAEPVTSVDVTAADMLADLGRELHAAGVELRFAEVKDPVKDKLERFGLLNQFGAGAFHPTVGAAVKAYLREYPVEWQDR
jgi:high affinity sulfate transporter 1